MPFIGVSALAIATMRPGTRGVGGGRNTESTPSGTTWIRSGSTPKSGAMSRAELADTVRIRDEPAGDLALHAQEAVPAAQRQPADATWSRRRGRPGGRR